MVSGDRPAAGRRRLRRRGAPRGQALWRADCWRKSLALQPRRPPHRPGRSAHLYPGGRARCDDCRRRARRLWRVFPLSHLAAAPGGRHPGPGGHRLARQRRAMGRGAAAKPLPRLRQAADAGGGLRRLGGGAQRGRGRRAHPVGRRQGVARLYPQPGIRAGGVQGPQPELSRLERRIAPADADCPAARLGQPVAARGVFAPQQRSGHAGF